MAIIVDMIVQCIVIMANEPQEFGGTLATYPMTIVFSILALPALGVEAVPVEGLVERREAVEAESQWLEVKRGRAGLRLRHLV